MKIYLVLLILAASIHSFSAHDVEGAFLKEGIVPEIVKAAPKQIVYISYPSGVGVDLGNELTPTQVKDRPEVTWEAEMGAFYTLVMIDPDAPSRVNQSIGEIRHWLVMNIPEYAIDQGDEIVEFIGSGPMKDTGIHRYIILVFKQCNGMIEHGDEPHTSSRSLDHRMHTSTMALAEKYNLGNPEFGNFYLAQYDSFVDVFFTQFSK